MSFLFVKVAVESLTPVQIAFGRALCGAAVLLVVPRLSGHRLPRERGLWWHPAVAALLTNTVPFVLFSYGEQHVPAAVAGIWNAVVPLVVLPASLLLVPQERATARRLAGLATGFAGVLAVLGVWTAPAGGELIGSLFCLGAVISHGFGFPYIRRYLAERRESPLALVAGQLLCAVVQLALPLPLSGPVPSGLPWRVVASMLALGALSTGVAYVLNYSVIRDAGAVTASTVTYLIPVFAVLGGVLFLGERLAWYQPLGALVIIAGAALTRTPARDPTNSGGPAPGRRQLLPLSRHHTSPEVSDQRRPSP
jgi:drug/metabolite transporter (DMT)-like permease